jgi:hypothetical protein
MLSEKQLIANRNNCLKSTGPRTLEGKIIASRNAVRHGLLSDSAEVLLKGENQDEFEAFHQNLLTNLDPQGQLEVLLAERITGFFWKLKRAGRMEKGLLDILCAQPQNAGPLTANGKIPFEIIITKAYEPSDQVQKSTTPQNTPANQVTPARNAVDSSDTQEFSEKLGRVAQQDFKSGSLLERLLRYEGQIERSLYRSLAELQKFQFLRRRNDAINVDEASVLHNNSDISSVAGDYPDSISVKSVESVVPVSPEAEKPNEAILPDNVAEASRFGDPFCHPRDLSAIALATAEGGDPDSSLGSLSRLSETKTDGPSSIDSKPNEAIDADNVSKVHVAQPPSAVFNVAE